MKVSTLIWGSLCLVGAGALRGPREVTVHHGEDLSVTCYYDDGFESYVKYWCKGEYRKTCDIIIKSTDRGSVNQYSMEDNPSWGRFTITKRQMRPEDSDTYHCGIERNWRDNMHAVRVTVLPGVCRKTQYWTSIVDFPSGFNTAWQQEVVKVSCKEQYDNRTFHLKCAKVSNVFQFYHPAELAPCTRKCGRLMDSGQKISMYPEKEYYGQDEEVTLTCPAGYSPNHSKVRCMRANGTNIWNVTEVFCIFSPNLIAFSNHSVFWKTIVVSCCLGVIPPMVVKLITILVILTVKFSGFVKRRSSSVEEKPRQRQPDEEMEISSRRARSNLYYKVKEDQKIPEDAEDDPDLIYENVEVTPSCDVYTSAC